MRGRKRKYIHVPKLSSSVKGFSFEIPMDEKTIEVKVKLYNDCDVLLVNKQLTEVLQGLISQ